MDQNNSSTWLKISLGILVLLSAGGGYYISQLKSKVSELEQKVVTKVSEKDKVLADLQGMKSMYEEMLTTNSSLSAELEAEKLKIESLIEEVKNSKGDAASMAKYKEKYITLDSKMKKLIEEIDVLKLENSKISSQRDSTIAVLDKKRQDYDTLTTSNKKMRESLDKASKLSLLNLKMVGIRVKNSGVIEESKKASKINVLRMSFVIAENSTTKPGEKTYYVQIIDVSNNVMGDKLTEKFGTDVLTYSYSKRVKYENKTIEISQDLAVKDLPKGNYYVNVFDKSNLVLKSSLVLN